MARQKQVSARRLNTQSRGDTHARVTEAGHSSLYPSPESLQSYCREVTRGIPPLKCRTRSQFIHGDAENRQLLFSVAEECFDLVDVLD